MLSEFILLSVEEPEICLESSSHNLTVVTEYCLVPSQSHENTSMALKQWGGPWFSGGHLMNQNVLILPKTAFEHFCGKPTHQRGQSYQPVHMGADREEKSNDNGKEKTSSELTVWICGCFPVHLQLVFPAFRCRFKFPVFPLLVGLLAPQARWLHPSAGLSVAALSVRWCPAHRQDC